MALHLILGQWRRLPTSYSLAKDSTPTPFLFPAETFMRPLGKTMKIAKETKVGEKDALRSLLTNYRNTPHPATGISPSSMLFRDGQRSTFPRVTATENAVAQARKRDLALKQEHKQNTTSGKYKIDSNFSLGDHVLIHNYQKQRKFDPLFLPDDFVVVELANNGQCITVKRLCGGTQLKRHPDDLKMFNVPREESTQPQRSEREVLQQYIQKLLQLTNDIEESYESFGFHSTPTGPAAHPISTNTRTTRSQGQSLAWNPSLNARDVLLPTIDNEQVNRLHIEEHWV